MKLPPNIKMLEHLNYNIFTLYSIIVYMVEFKIFPKPLNQAEMRTELPLFLNFELNFNLKNTKKNASIITKLYIPILLPPD